jgi:hypothetical protein
VCVCVCVCVEMNIYIHVYIYIYIYISFLLYSCFTLTCVCIYIYTFIYVHTHTHLYTYIHMLYSCRLALKYLCIFRLHLCFYSCFMIYVTAVILFNLHIHLYSCFTRTLLVLFLLCVCVCVCRLTGLVGCVQHSEGLRRDGGWERDVLQQRAAGEAPLEEAAAHVCVLMHVGAAQARTPGRQERPVRPLASTAAQVRDACHMMPGYPI